jgi:hypothetical protein
MVLWWLWHLTEMSAVQLGCVQMMPFHRGKLFKLLKIGYNEILKGGKKMECMECQSRLQKYGLVNKNEIKLPVG